MESADLAALSRLVDSALAQAPSARADWIAALVGHDAALAPALRRALERIDNPHAAAPLGTLPKIEATRAAAASGDLVGPYRLEHGDTVVMFTDGVTEAANAAGEFYGRGRLEALLGRIAPGATAGEVLREILADLRAFVGAAEQSDDVALVVVRWLGA